MSPRVWHCAPDNHGGAWLRDAAGAPMAYVTHVEDALAILAALRLWEAKGITIGADVLHALAVFEARQGKETP